MLTISNHLGTLFICLFLSILLSFGHSIIGLCLCSMFLCMFKCLLRILIWGNQKLIPHNGHKRIQEEREGGGLVLLAFACKVQNHIICTIQLNPQPREYAFISWFHNQNPMPTNQRVVCDHCAQLSSAYLDRASEHKIVSSPLYMIE